MPVIDSQGNNALVSRFKLYNIIKDEFVMSTRFATMQTIERINAVPVGPVVGIPACDLNHDGMTAQNYSTATQAGPNR